MTDFKVCKLCVMFHGLRGAELAAGTCKYAFRTEAELIEHLKKEHNIVVVDK